MSVYEKHNYLNKGIKYIKNAVITEYDMKNGGISILKHEGYLSDEDYNYLMNDLDKHQRNVEIGIWLKDQPEVSKGLMEGFREARRLFFEANNIQDSEVLTIKKDAIFLIDKFIDVEQVNEDYLFRKKNQYTSYINLSGKEFYYNLMEDIFDIKGFPEETLKRQENYLFKFVKECLKLDADGKSEELFVKLLEFKNDYVTKNLPVEYYYDILFNGYLFKYEDHNVMLDQINKDLLNNEYFNFNSNLNLIIELISNLLN